MIENDKISVLAEKALKVLREQRRMNMDELYTAMFGPLVGRQVGELRTDLVVAMAALRRMGLVGLTVQDDGTTHAWLAPDKSNPADVAAFLRG